MCCARSSKLIIICAGGIYTVAQLLFTSLQDAAHKCRISPIELKTTVESVCRECNNFQLQYLDDIKLEGDELFSTGDAEIDLALGGGIRTGMIWEFVGER
jgi:DNA repair protein RAD57